MVQTADARAEISSGRRVEGERARFGGVYEARGEYQIYVESLEPVGRGALQLAFEQLKKRLEAEGLFDAKHKKPLPVLPSRIGLITSPTGAAVRDVVRILRRRFPNVHLTLFPVRVQGDGSTGL